MSVLVPEPRRTVPVVWNSVFAVKFNAHDDGEKIESSFAAMPSCPVNASPLFCTDSRNGTIEPVRKAILAGATLTSVPLKSCVSGPGTGSYVPIALCQSNGEYA